MCNCKGKLMNNLSIPGYIRMAKEVWDRIKDIPKEELGEPEWQELNMIYWQLYPNSKGQPANDELYEIIRNASNYKG